MHTFIVKELQDMKLQVIGFTAKQDNQQTVNLQAFQGFDLQVVAGENRQEAFLRLLRESSAEEVLVVDLDRVAPSAVPGFIQAYRKQKRGNHLYYAASRKRKLWFGFMDACLWRGDRVLTETPVLVGEKSLFLKAYAGEDLDSNLLRALSYSLQKAYVKFAALDVAPCWKESEGTGDPAVNYLLRLPFRFLVSGAFFKTLFSSAHRAERDMVYRLLMLVFGVFVFLYMPYISKDFGISGDEYVDHRHAGYVIDFFTKGDKAALNQPKTALHLYGNSVQVVAAVVARAIGADDVYAVRHFICALVGASGVVFIGLLGLRFGGGLCGLLSMLMLFFSPRFFGHSMNNLKDIPFAVGYLIAIFYFVRLFDRFPVIKLRHALGAVAGIALALGTRSGGLILFPYLFMYAGLFYILWVGFKNFYRFLRYRREVENILFLLVLVLGAGYFLSIITWPFALAKPLTNVVLSLKEFTNYNIGLRTIFEGKQMMSSMLPVHYAPKYLMIASPLVVVVGFVGYLFFLVFRKREFSLLSFFLLFALVFPVFWVIYQKSNLYGGIRHLLFVMPFMVLLAARFWTLVLAHGGKLVKVGGAVAFVALLFLPARHMAVNHPSEYVYFNELVGGVKGAYGDYETDYYYNSLKKAADWFKQNVDYKDKSITIVTNHSSNLAHYFRKDTNVHIIYGRYYEKYGADWDYMIFDNVYINSFQLKNGLFPVKEGFLYSVDVDGLPMSVVGKRTSKDDFRAVQLMKENRFQEAIVLMKNYLAAHPWNEEIWMRLARAYYLVDSVEQTYTCADKALALQPQLMDALNLKAFSAVDLGRFAEAHRAVDAMLAQNDIASQSYYMKAWVYYHERQDQKALEYLNRALRYNPRNVQALALAGDILYRNYNYASAIGPYEQVVRMQKADENVFLSLADCYSRTGKYAGIKPIADLLRREGKDKFRLDKIEIRALLLQKQLAEAGKRLETYSPSDDDTELMVLRALYDWLSGRQAAAMERLEQVLAKDKTNGEALQLQQMMRQQGNMKR